jgi:hypothetical protein
MAKSRLRDSAQQLRVELARARLTAMERGVPLEFRYRAGEGKFRFAALSPDDRAGEFGGNSGRSPIGQSQPRMSARPDSGGAPVVEDITEAELPEGVVFAAPQSAPVESEFVSEDSISTTLEDDVLESEGWSSAIVFLPDGTATNARLALRDGEGSQVTVELRGVTGLAKPGNIESYDESEISGGTDAGELKTARDGATLMR